MKKDFCGFIKFYFNYTSNKLYDNDAPIINHRYIKRSERLFTVLLSYILLTLSCLSLLFNIFTSNGYYWVSMMGIAISVVLLIVCRFSFIYYLLIYLRVLASNNSINSQIIADECIYLRLHKDVRKIILTRYKIIDVRGGVFSVRYYLIDRSKAKKNIKTECVVLKISPTKVFLNGRTVLSEKMQDLSGLANHISNV